tara:strand:- start:64 stop:1275 length:1212 start_codon:yes stop_codon:yes gene_type:complete
MNGTYQDVTTHSNKAVLVDISAHWCGPCWSWHGTHIMQELYHDFGPNGTDEFMVFWIDGDANSSLSTLNGGGSSMGDWVTGVDYPIIGPNGQGAAVASNYTFGGYPTLFLHCGIGTAPEIQRNEKWVFWNDVLGCSNAFQFQDPDATMLLHHGMQICSAGNEVEVEIYNASSSMYLNTAEVELRDPSGTLVYTQYWQGNLSPLSKGTITLNHLVTSPGTWTAKVILPNGVADTRPNGDEENIEVTLGPNNINQNLTVNIVTDQYGSETTWSIGDGSVSYMTGGPYTDNTTTQTPSTGTIPANACVTFTIEDSYGDGICCTYGNGSYTITDGNGTIVATGGGFGFKEEVVFEIGNTTVGIDEVNYVTLKDDRIFDILGREWKCEFIDLPRGLYIINHNKIIKTK